MTPALQAASAQQLKASDPAASAWVSANAGSGKTHVLAQRVLRLLLAGAQPGRILCLTFTKAAAANMTERVFDRLGKWTRLDDDELTNDILGLGHPRPTRVDLELARKLFARVIETPGGLKIQTIHAFCERVLHLFPFEANVPAGFRPLDEREAALLRAEAEARVFASPEPAIADALARVAPRVAPDGFSTLVAETARLGDTLAIHGDADAYAQKLAARLGLAPGETEEEIAREMRQGGGGPVVWKQWAKALTRGGKTDQKLANWLIGAANMPDPDMALSIYLQVFLVENGTAPRKSMATKAVHADFPDLVDALYAERDRLFAALDRRRAAAAVTASRDLARLARACEAAYARAKAQRSALDFDDLIARTEALFARADAAWVLYKLDRGVEHILVDEAQDTSRPQWKILAKLAEDFLSGAGAGPANRTFFAVGDEKQSIFSFQGAAPDLFDKMHRYFATRHEKAERAFESVKLFHSFRSSPFILEAVDEAFKVPEVWAGVSVGEPAPLHEAVRGDLPGLVELWPPLAGEPAPEPGDWAAPLDAQKLTHPANALADRIAATIARWIAPGSPERVVDPKTNQVRPVRAGDILILVRSRGPLFEAMTRALRRARIPAAGADRLTLGAHIAVLDLCAAARAALNRDDDLALAGALKSPLIRLDDDALLTLAPERPGALADALEASSFTEAKARVAAWRARAGGGPFDFFARLLGADGGRRALIGRLGPEAGDAIDEFLARALAHENGEAPSLIRFLDEIEGKDAEIKRDMEGAGQQVRVMTVHAAKGLEAPIVILPDTTSAPSGRHDPKWLTLPALHSGAAPIPVWAGPAANDCAAMTEARLAARDLAAGEHRRLLYVAMTRAAQRLIVCGFEGQRERAEDCWWNLIAKGLKPLMREVPSTWDAGEKVLRLGDPASGGGPVAAEPSAGEYAAPSWLAAPAARELTFSPAAPSRPVGGPVSPERLARIEEGRLAHRLLQSLPALAPERREKAAQTFLARRGGTIAPERRAEIAARVLALIGQPDLQSLFGPDSRAEVAFSALLPRPDGAPVPVSGRIDRMGVNQTEVIIADFKTGARSTRVEYRRQLAIYRAAVARMFPGRIVRAVLLWVESGDFESFDEASLRATLDDWAAGPASPS